MSRSRRGPWSISLAVLVTAVLWVAASPPATSTVAPPMLGSSR